MGNVKIKMNHAGMEELLKYDCQGVITETAERVKNACDGGGEYKSDLYVGKSRCNASVGTADPHAYYSNLKHNTLLNALSAAGGQ